MLEDRIERLREFSLRVKKSHEVQANDTAFILHYDCKSGDLRPYFWYFHRAPQPQRSTLTSSSYRPSDKKNNRYKPSALDMLRLTHFFLGPCCYCAWLDGKKYTEAKIGLALAVTKTSDDDCLGQYIAICPEQKCGYFGMCQL